MTFESLLDLALSMGSRGYIRDEDRNNMPDTKMFIIVNPDDETERFMYDFSEKEIDVDESLDITKVSHLILLQENGYRDETCYQFFVKYRNRWYMGDTMEGSFQEMKGFTLKRFWKEVKELNEYLNSQED